MVAVVGIPPQSSLMTALKNSEVVVVVSFPVKRVTLIDLIPSYYLEEIILSDADIEPILSFEDLVEVAVGIPLYGAAGSSPYVDTSARSILLIAHWRGPPRTLTQ